MPSSLNNFVTACSLTQQNVRVISIHCFLIKILEVLKMGVLSLKHLSTYLWQKLNTKANGNHRHQTSSDVNVNDCTVAFFPHKSLRYGAFYNKTYLFENDPESLFYKKEVLTIFDDETDPVSQRFLRMHGIPNTSLRFQTSKKHLLNSMYNVWKATDKFKWLVDFGSIRKSISNLLILQFLISVELNCSRIRNLHSLKLAYFHYDILVSNALLLACHINSVTTVSMQDRTISSLWETGLIYDHYFIAGEGFKEIMEKRDYAIQQYHVVGMPRNKYIVEPHAKWKYQKYIDIKAKGLKLVVCFDIPPLNYFFEGLESETPSKKCIFDFYLSLIKLAEEFQDLYIVVKPKIQYTFANIFDKNTKAKVKSLNNFEVITDLKKYSPYVLAYYSDLIIGKHTSIMEEAFSVGKKIIFYDSEKYLTSTTHVVNNIDVVVDNYNDLKKRVIDVMMLDQYIESNEWEKFNRHFFQGDSQQNGFGLIKQNLSEIYAGLELE